jgi:GT2 family glycosyltransferase
MMVVTPSAGGASEITVEVDRSVTAVVISYNSAAELPRCLGAIRAGGQPVVVVDNASRDDSAAIAHGLGDPGVQVLELDGNTGFAGGCNRGFRAVPSDVPYVAFANPDVLVDPDCLARCVEVLHSRPEVAGVAPLLIRTDRITVDSVGQVLRRRTLEVEDLGYGRPLTDDLLESREVLAACGALGVYRRSALEQVADENGPWAEHFFCFWEDLELGWRLTNRGWKLVTVPDAVAVHGRGAGARRGRGPLRWRRSAELEACIVSNRWLTLIRHLHTLDAVRRLPVLWMWDLGLVTLSVVRRPALAGHLARRLRLLSDEWRRREQFPRRRLVELPCRSD